MTTQHLDERGTIQPAPQASAFVELRGPSGRLYGRLDPQTLVIEVKRKNEPAELIDLKQYLRAAK